MDNITEEKVRSAQNSCSILALFIFIFIHFFISLKEKRIWKGYLSIILLSFTQTRWLYLLFRPFGLDIS